MVAQIILRSAILMVSFLVLNNSAWARNVAKTDDDYDVLSVDCDKHNQMATIRFNDDRDPASSEKRYNLDKIASYTNGLSPTVVCNFANEKKVSLIGGRSEEHPQNDNVTVIVNGITEIRLFSGYIRLVFKKENILVTKCGYAAQECTDTIVSYGKPYNLP